MSTTKIGWTDLTLNPVIGCTHAGYTAEDGKKTAHPGCDHCYAETMCSRTLPGFESHNACSKGGKWTGEIKVLHERLAWPFVRKEYKQRADGKQRRCFLTSLSDMGHPALGERDWMAVQGMMLLAPWIIWQDLTKRPERQAMLLRKYTPAQCVDVLCRSNATVARTALPYELWHGFDGPRTWNSFPHIHRYVSVSDQPTADALIPLLLQMPASVRGVSLEPMLGPVDLLLAAYDGAESLQAMGGINHVIVGGESGRGARPFCLEWALDVIWQCEQSGVPCFVKQMGSDPYTEDVTQWEWFDADSPLQLSGKGEDMNEWPECLRVRQHVGHKP